MAHSPVRDISVIIYWRPTLRCRTQGKQTWRHSITPSTPSLFSYLALIYFYFASELRKNTLILILGPTQDYNYCLTCVYSVNNQSKKTQTIIFGMTLMKYQNMMLSFKSNPDHIDTSVTYSFNKQKLKTKISKGFTA